MAHGIVMRVEDDRLVVLFDEVGYKTLALAAVTENGLLERRVRVKSRRSQSTPSAVAASPALVIPFRGTRVQRRAPPVALE